MASRAPLVFWAVTAAVLTAMVLIGVPSPGPLDDPSEGDQRAGFLIDRDEARRVPDLQLPGGAVGSRPVVVVFDRRVPSPRRFSDLRQAVPEGVAAVIVVPHARSPRRAAHNLNAPIASDPDGSVAQIIGMPVPRDGGPPIGYAVLDDDAFVRYATLDPGYLEHGFEVEIIAGALT